MQKHSETLRYLCHCRDGKIRRPLLEALPDSAVIAVCECAHNILRGVPKLTEAERLALARHKSLCRYLNDQSVPVQQKRTKLTQVGSGFWTALLKPIIDNLPWLLQPAPRRR